MLRIFLTILKRTEHCLVYMYMHFLLQILDQKLSLACQCKAMNINNDCINSNHWIFFAFKLRHQSSTHNWTHKALHLSLLKPYYIKFSHHINFVILRFMHFTILQKVLYFESLLFCVYQWGDLPQFWQFTVKILWPKYKDCCTNKFQKLLCYQASGPLTLTSSKLTSLFIFFWTCKL